MNNKPFQHNIQYLIEPPTWQQVAGGDIARTVTVADLMDKSNINPLDFMDQTDTAHLKWEGIQGYIERLRKVLNQPGTISGVRQGFDPKPNQVQEDILYEQGVIYEANIVFRGVQKNINVFVPSFAFANRQKIQEEIRKVLPGATVLHMDRKENTPSQVERQTVILTQENFQQEDDLIFVSNYEKLNELLQEVYDVEVEDFFLSEEGRKPKLNKPFRTPDGPKKFAVYVKNKKGNVVKVTFGDPNMEIKRDNPERKKSFRARHKCDQQKDKTSAAYWSCKNWEDVQYDDNFVLTETYENYEVLLEKKKKTKAGKEMLNDFISKYGEEEGKKRYYAYWGAKNN